MRLKMNNFDWKKFLLEKGERAALYACLGIMALMLIFSLFMPGRGLFSGSPAANEKKLRDQNRAAKDKIDIAAPTPEERAQLLDIKDDLLKSGKQEKVDPARHRGDRPLYVGVSGEDTKRRAPKVLPPTEYRATVVFVQMPIVVFDQKEGTKLMVLRGVKDVGSPPLGPVTTGQQAARGFEGLQKQLGPQGFKQFTKPPTQGGGEREPTPQPKGDENPLKGPAQGGKVEYVAINELRTELKDGRLAEDIKPLRMALVVGSFPLREQILAHQRALRLRDPAQVFAERIDGKGLQFQFLGLNIERRVVGPDGKPGAWEKVNIDEMYKPLAVLTGRRFADEKPELLPLMDPPLDGLVLPRPLQARGDVYPDLERELKGIKETLAEMEKQAKAGQPVPQADKRFTVEGFNPFSRSSAEEQPEKPPDAETKPPPVEGGQLDNRPQWVPPEYCPLRFIDTTVAAGKTYEYRIQVRMANPNYKHPNVRSPDLAEKKEIVGPDSGEWFLVKDDKDQPLQVKVPQDSYFYAAEPVRGADPKQARVQFHRWLDIVNPNPTSQATFAVGDWVVADQVPVNRGEYLARTHRVEVPVWMHNPGMFTLARNPANPSQPHLIPLAFPRQGESDTILVDFQGGWVSHGRATDKAPLELIYLSPDGRLLARDSETDKQDPERDKRQKQYKKAIDEIKEAKKKEEKEKEKKPMPGGGIGGIGG